MKTWKEKVLCVDNTCFKFQGQKKINPNNIFTMYQDVLFGETIMETISILPTLTRSQGIRNCLYTMGVLAQDFLYVNIMCAKFQDQTSYTTKYIHNGGHTHWYMLAVIKWYLIAC